MDNGSASTGGRNIQGEGRTPKFLWKNAISLLSLVVASIAMAGTIWQGIENAKQNEILIRPHLALTSDVGNFSDQGIYLTNNGSGQAKIVAYKIYYRNSEFSSFGAVVDYLSSKSGDSSFLSQTGLDQKIIKRIRDKAVHRGYSSGNIFPADDRTGLFTMKEDLIGRRIPTVQFFRNDLGVEIYYCSLRDTACRWECINRQCDGKPAP